MPRLSLQQFREVNADGFAGWVTAVAFGYEGARPYVDPVDARYGAPASPLGGDPVSAPAAFEQWCAEHLVGDHFLTGGPTGSLVYCRLGRDADLLRQLFSPAPGNAPQG
jgi:hypothetical protein